MDFPPLFARSRMGHQMFTNGYNKLWVLGGYGKNKQDSKTYRYLNNTLFIELNMNDDVPDSSRSSSIAQHQQVRCVHSLCNVEHRSNCTKKTRITWGVVFIYPRHGYLFCIFFVVFDSHYQYDFLRSMQPMRPMQYVLLRSILTNTTHTINATNTCNQHNPSAPTGRLGTYFFTVQSVVEFTPRRQTRGVRYFGQNGAFRGGGHQPWRLVSGGIKHVYFIPSFYQYFYLYNFVVLVLNRGLITFSGHSFKNIF